MSTGVLMKLRASYLKYGAVVWSVLLVGGYILYMARGALLPGARNETRIFPSSKVGSVYRPTSQHRSQPQILPSSKHATLGPDILYGDGSVQFDKNPFINSEDSQFTRRASTQPASSSTLNVSPTTRP